jgi:hypothetical protein
VRSAALRSTTAGLVATALLLAPQVALACSVCTGGESPNVGRAFLIGSLALSLLPLAAGGGLAFWIWRRSRAIERPAPLRAPSAQPHH